MERSGRADGHPVRVRKTIELAAGSPTLEIGYVTPDEEFAGFVVSDDPRAEPVTAKARVLPLFTSGIAGGPSEIVNRVCPDMTLRLDSLVPL